MSMHADVIRDDKTQTYQVKGGLNVEDETGCAEVFYASVEMRTTRSVYRVMLNSLHLVCPAETGLYKTPISFGGSQHMHFEWESQGQNRERTIVKITETDERATTTLYVNLQEVLDGYAYAVYYYIPKKLSLHEIRKKYEDIQQRHPSFRPDMIAYNRHGVALFGKDVGKEEDVLYWANPYEEYVTLRQAECLRLSKEGTSSAKSADGQIHFQCLVSKYYQKAKGWSTVRSYQLNGEEAAEIK